MKTFRNRMNQRKCSVVSCLTVGAGLLVMAAPARAGHRHPRAAKCCAPVWVPPAYETRSRTVITPAVYKERTRNVWHSPVYEVRRVRVVIPAEIETQRVPRYDRRGRLIRFDLVERVVRPARKAWKTDRVLVKPGYWETVVERICVKRASTQVVYDNVLVRSGHWSRPKCRTIHKSGRRDRVVRRRGMGGSDGFDLQFAVLLDR